MSRGYISVALRRIVVDDFAARCAYCHSPEFLLDGLFEIDHITPASAGGLTVRNNLCYSCRLCNEYKGARQSGIDLLTKRRAPLFHPRCQTWSRHFQWSTDGKDIEGRTICGRATVAALQMNNEALARMRGHWLRMGARPPEWQLPSEQENA